MVERLQDDLIRVEDEDSFQRGYELMETESDELEEDVRVIRVIVVV